MTKVVAALRFFRRSFLVKLSCGTSSSRQNLSHTSQLNSRCYGTPSHLDTVMAMASAEAVHSEVDIMVEEAIWLTAVNARHDAELDPAEIQLQLARTQLASASNSNQSVSVATTPATMSVTSPRVTFLNLPIEIRVHIYQLSGCLRILQSPHYIVTMYLSDLTPESSTEHYHPQANLWVNRRSAIAAYGGLEHLKHDGSGGADVAAVRKSAKEGKLVRTRSRCVPGRPRGLNLAQFHHTRGVDQPVLTQVSRQVRADTLPIFYGKHNFYFTLYVQLRAQTLVQQY